MHKIWIIWKYFGHVCSITNTGQSCIIYCSVYNGLMYSMTQYLLYKIASHRCIEGNTPKKKKRQSHAMHICVFHFNFQTMFIPSTTFLTWPVNIFKLFYLQTSNRRESWRFVRKNSIFLGFIHLNADNALILVRTYVEYKWVPPIR